MPSSPSTSGTTLDYPVQGTAILGDMESTPTPDVAPVFNGVPWWSIIVAAGATILGAALYLAYQNFVGRCRAVEN
jgi:hypothetical protein